MPFAASGSAASGSASFPKERVKPYGYADCGATAARAPEGPRSKRSNEMASSRSGGRGERTRSARPPWEAPKRARASVESIDGRAKVAFESRRVRARVAVCRRRSHEKVEKAVVNNGASSAPAIQNSTSVENIEAYFF